MAMERRRPKAFATLSLFASLCHWQPVQHTIKAETSARNPISTAPSSEAFEFESEAKAQRHDNIRLLCSGLSAVNRSAGLSELSCAAAAAASHTSFISSGTSATLTRLSKSHCNRDVESWLPFPQISEVISWRHDP